MLLTNQKTINYEKFIQILEGTTPQICYANIYRFLNYF